jgi:hypothetical protein
MLHFNDARLETVSWSVLTQHWYGNVKCHHSLTTYMFQASQYFHFIHNLVWVINVKVFLFYNFHGISFAWILQNKGTYVTNKILSYNALSFPLFLCLWVLGDTSRNKKDEGGGGGSNNTFQSIIAMYGYHCNITWEPFNSWHHYKVPQQEITTGKQEHMFERPS